MSKRSAASCWRRSQLFLQMGENLINDDWLFN
jgi:hypothetical protein